jgi:hypothetical protein
VVSWRAGVVLLGVLVALGVYAFVSRPQPAPAPAAFMACRGLDSVDVRVAGGSRVTELERATPREPWRLSRPRPAPADSSGAQYLMSSIEAIKVLNTIDQPQPASAYGLDRPREVVACRVMSGRSYNLSVGNQSFDGSGYYSQKTGDSRVYVISSVAVDEFDKVLAEPPVQPTPSPTR